VCIYIYIYIYIYGHGVATISSLLQNIWLSFAQNKSFLKKKKTSSLSLKSDSTAKHKMSHSAATFLLRVFNNKSHFHHVCVTWLIRVCDMTHSCVWHDSFVCVTWIIRVCDMTHWCVWHDSLVCVAWLLRTPHCMCIYIIYVCVYIYMYKYIYIWTWGSNDQ